MNVLKGLNGDNEFETEEFFDRNSSFSSGGCSICSCKCKLNDHFEDGK